MTLKFTSLVIVVAASAVLGAQAPAGYDRTSETMVAGTIKAVVSFPADDGSVGVHFDLKTANGMVDVRVAPAMFIGQNNFWFFTDEEVQIIGAPVVRGGPLWAKAIQKGSTLLLLRDDAGVPKWTPAFNGTDGCGVKHPPIYTTTER